MEDVVLLLSYSNKMTFWMDGWSLHVLHVFLRIVSSNIPKTWDLVVRHSKLVARFFPFLLRVCVCVCFGQQA